MGFKTDGIFDGTTCRECGTYVLKNRRSLGNHLARSHDDVGGIRGYVLRHLLDGLIPTCLCGCGRDVVWHGGSQSFNDYLAGHNPAGFRVRQPTFTSTQVRRRNLAIRRAYRERGDEIGKKISDAVVVGLSTPSAKRKMSAHMSRMWADPTSRASMTATRRRVWAERGDELRRRIFTPEFGRKIAEANMRRDVRRTSVEEARFVDVLRRIFGADDVVPSRWIVTPSGPRCFDAYVTSLDVLVEYDGVYWHGLDRTSGYTHDQLTSIAGDLEKAAFVRDAGLSLARFRGDVAFDDVDRSTFLDHAYHLVVRGSVVREGCRRFADDEPIVRRDDLLVAEETPAGRARVERRFLPAVLRLLRAHVGYWGWFYPPVVGTAVDVVAAVRAASSTFDGTSYRSTGRAGVAYLKSTFRSFWGTLDGPVATLDRHLDAVVRYRMGLGRSRPYDYVLPDGRTVTAAETFDVSPATVRAGFVVNRHVVSSFKPRVAFDVYRRHLGDVPAPSVWDPSGGFGGRMLGFYAAYPAGRYVCCEPARATADDLEALGAALVGLGTGFTFEVLRRGSEVGPPDGTFDMAFTSPPYLDRERYYDEPGQCWRDFPTEASWTTGFLVPTLASMRSAVVPGGPVVLNVSTAVEALVRSSAPAAGLAVDGALSTTMDVGRDHLARSRGACGRAHEAVLVLRRS